jgi:ABC-type transport system involved in cytochrome c biogenesis permease component
LKGTDIVVAKGLAHGLRAITLGLAVLPVLTIPFLVGGVSWKEAALSAMVNANAMCWALTAGLLASAWSKARTRALLRAAILAFAFFFVLGAGTGVGLMWALNTKRAGQSEINLDYALAAGCGFLMDIGGHWSSLASIRQLVWVIGQVSICSLFVSAAVVVASGSKIRRSWQEEPPTRRQVWLQQTFCTPVLWVAFFRRWMRRKLEHNPIGWLEQRTWSGRLVTWGWVAVLISIYSAVLTDRPFFRDVNELQETMAWLLAGSMAMSAAGSFRRERETGVLELLLVSPLGEHQIISGRLRGLWGQFLPAVGLLLAVWSYFLSFQPDSTSVGAIMFFAVTFVAVPVFGLYFSLRCRNFLTAFLSTAAVGFLLPLVLSGVVEAVRWTYSTLDFAANLGPSGTAAVCQGAVGAFCWRRLYHRLKRRAFPLERARI